MVAESGPGRRPDRVLSRQAELATLEKFVTGGAGPALVIVGEPGVGKTTVWEHSVQLATGSGGQVLWARTSAAETSMSFAALRDLIDGVDPNALAMLPAPQVRSIEIAVRRLGASGEPPDPLAISAGFLGLVRLLAAEGPLLVAIDDAHLLDQSSQDVLSFVARRLTTENIRFLLARRVVRPPDVERALRPVGLEQLSLTGLSVGAIRHLLAERLDLRLARRVLLQLHETSQGNPLYALELGRMLAERGQPEAGEDLPFPELDDDIFGARIAGLPPAMRRALLAVALSADLSRRELEALVDPAVVEEGVDLGLLIFERSRVSPSHPLVAAAARHQASEDERLALHADLAASIEDPLLRSRHLAAASSEPEAAIADTVAEGADLAAGRGLTEEAVVLAGHALRLTPRGNPEWAARVLKLAGCYLGAGQSPEARSLLTTHMDELPPGPLRARGHLLLGLAAEVAIEAVQLELAMTEAGDDLEVKADILSRKAFMFAASFVRRLDEAEIWAAEAVAMGRRCGGEAEARAQLGAAWIRAMRGKPIDPHLDRTKGSISGEASIDRPRGVQAAFRGEVAAARRIFQNVREDAESRGQYRVLLLMSVQLCELEMRAGHLAEAKGHLEEVEQWSYLPDLVYLGHRLHGMHAAVQGDPAEASRWAHVFLEGGADVKPNEWDRIEVTRSLGLVALFGRNAEEAVDKLGQVWDLTQREHIDDPGVYPAAGDLIEALVWSGDVDSAAEVVETLRARAIDQHHPWALAVVGRSDGFLRLQRGDDDDAFAQMEAAARSFDRLDLCFDAARTRLLMGQMQRRHRKSGAAREALGQAAAAFEQLGCTGWAELARDEKSRITGRRPAPERV